MPRRTTEEWHEMWRRQGAVHEGTCCREWPCRHALGMFAETVRREALDEAIDACKSEYTVDLIAQKCAYNIENIIIMDMKNAKTHS